MCTLWYKMKLVKADIYMYGLALGTVEWKEKTHTHTRSTLSNVSLLITGLDKQYTNSIIWRNNLWI